MNTARLRAVSSLMGAACWGAVVCSAAPAAARSPSCEQVERYTLKNGLEVVLRPDHELPNVAIVSSVHAGSRHDPPGYEGLAHYVEHLTFREALSLGSVNELYDQAGATRVNAMTGLDTTDYFAQLPRAQIERGLWLEARRLAIGLDALTPGPAEEEHRVILREHEMRYGKSGLGLEMLGVTFQALFPEGHPYHDSRRQTASSVGALGLADARWFFARYYRPDRIRLTLLGDFDAAAVRPLVDKYFAALAARELPIDTASSLAQAAQDAAECRRSEATGAGPHGSVRISTRARRESVTFLWLSPAGDEPERWSGILAAFARRVGDAARDSQLASGASIDLIQAELGDYWVLSVALLPSQPFERVAPLVASAFAELKRSPPDAGEQNAGRQALDLNESRERSLLSRALDLSRRECRPSRCLTPADQMSAETIAGLDRFDPAQALRVEFRHSFSASPDGDVERVP